MLGRGNDGVGVTKAVERLIQIIFFRDWVKVLIFTKIRHKNRCFFSNTLVFFNFADSKVQD